MPSDWLEYLALLKAQASPDAPGPKVSLWPRFKSEAATSHFRDALADLVQHADPAPSRLRVAIAVTIARLLGPLEWPPAWDSKRMPLVSALDALLEATSERVFPDHVATLDGAEQDAAVMAHAILFFARELLRRPCPRNELPIVAKLCNVGTATAMRAFQRARLRAFENPSVLAHAEEEWFRFTLAWATYLGATREMNDAVGSVLFRSLIQPNEGGQ